MTEVELVDYFNEHVAQSNGFLCGLIDNKCRERCIEENPLRCNCFEFDVVQVPFLVRGEQQND